MGGKIPSGNTAWNWREGSGYKDGIFYSKRPVEPIPEDTYLDFTTYTLQSGNYLDRVALVEAPTGKSLLYRELVQQVKSVASGLADIGVKQGDVVMILSPNSIQYPVLLLAVASIGAVVTALNPLNTTKEIVKQAEDSKTAYLAAIPGLTAAAAILRIPLILMDSDIQESSPKPEVTPIAYFTGLLQADPRTAPKVRIRQTDTALLLYSSGTTGTSKGVVISHRNVIAASILTDSFRSEDVQRTYIVTIPIFHMYGMVLVICAQLERRSKLVILPKFEFSTFLAAIERYKVTHAQLVPPIFNALTRSPLVENYDLSSLAFIGVGAAPVPKDTLIECSKRYKGAFLRQVDSLKIMGVHSVAICNLKGLYAFTKFRTLGWALTESTGIGSSTPPGSSAPRHGSAGLLAANTDAMIVDLESGKPLPPNKTGEIWLRGPSMMQGYLNNERATAETLDKQGWLHTGDVGYISEDGYIYIVDRLKELIKYNAFQVAPAELEAVLTAHPQITDVAVAGFPDEMTGQIPVAFIVRHSNSSLSEPEVKQFVAEQVAPYKKVRKVFFVDSIPRSPSGKILRRQLRLPPLPTSKL